MKYSREKMGFWRGSCINFLILTSIITGYSCKTHPDIDKPDPVEIAATDDEAYNVMRKVVTSKMTEMGFVENKTFFIERNAFTGVGGKNVKSDMKVGIDTDNDPGHNPDRYLLLDHDVPGEETQFGGTGEIDTDRVDGKEIKQSTMAPVTTTGRLETAYKNWIDRVFN